MGVRVSVVDDTVVVAGIDTTADRRAWRFLRAVMGGRETDAGWVIPKRHRTVDDVVVRVHEYFSAAGIGVQHEGVASQAVERDVRRNQSFMRSKQAGTGFRQGTPAVPFAQAEAALRELGWNEEARKLKPHQRSAVEHGLSGINVANFSVPGAGKTAATLAVAATHYSQKLVDVIVVVGPLNCFRPWELEAGAALNGALRTMRIRGARAQRLGLYPEIKRGDLCLMSYPTAASDKRELIELCRRLRVMLIVDESHRVKRFNGGLWAPALVELAREARLRIVLSGTPMPQSGLDLYSQLNILWPGRELTGPRDDFKVRVRDAFDDLLKELQPFIFRTGKGELNIPPYTVHKHDVPLDGLHREVYALMEDLFRQQVQILTTVDEQLEALKRGRPIRLMQAAGNPVLLDPRRAEGAIAPAAVIARIQEFRRAERSGKFRKALELVRGIAGKNEKVVVWSSFLGNLDQFQALVEEELKIPTFRIDGRVPAGDEPTFDDRETRVGDAADATREDVIERFLDQKDQPAVLVANPAACSESISLHSACTKAIYIDRTYDCATYLQSLDRIHRLGLPQDAIVEVHLLQATFDGRDTIDQFVDRALQRKETRMKSLLEGAELRPIGAPDNPSDVDNGDREDLEELLRFLLGE